MTDKQIIIDVTQCPYYKEDKTCTYLPYKSKCEGDCNWTTYKEMEEQIKRKEQECEELKKQLQSDKGLITSTGKMNYQLVQEYDKLKTALTQIKEIAEICSFTDSSELLLKRIKLILQEISECEVEDDLPIRHTIYINNSLDFD